MSAPVAGPTFAPFALGLTAETAFDVLAVAKRLKAGGKDVVELQIGDSPFPSTESARSAGKHAIDSGQTRYGPSAGLPEFREAAAKAVRDEFGIPAAAENVVVAPGAKPFEQFFCEAFLEPGDGVMVFEPKSAPPRGVVIEGGRARIEPGAHRAYDEGALRGVVVAMVTQSGWRYRPVLSFRSRRWFG